MMNWWLVLAGLLVHLVFFYSIFDIYFTSPLVHGMSQQSTPLPAPAKRLVLFVADGLRADKFYQLDSSGNTRAPYLRSVAQKHGAWGISHTRVPTESRTGHVALIAGFYEDVSAITKGWKENPVDFDHVFNQSRYTWSWGSPDILPMFAKGDSAQHVFVNTYPGESEDFAGANLYKLDTWVFDKVQDFLENAKKNEDLRKKLHSEKVVFFLHLLGIDTNGHAHKPFSENYLDNINVVDTGVKETVQRIEEFFQDEDTAFVFSADHGMTNWGSHGAGHPSETLTPLVVWGAGARQALSSAVQYEDGFESEWQIGTKRSDVNQADIAPLMAALIGIQYPLNSVGHVPLDYLNGTMQFKAETSFTNARQILEQFQIKMEQKRKTTLSRLFVPFKSLTPSIQADVVRSIRRLLNNAEYDQAIIECDRLIELALEGLNYYHNYDRFFLGLSITMGFLGWMTYILTVLIQKHTPISQSHQSSMNTAGHSFWASPKGIRFMFAGGGLVIAGLLYIQSLPWTHYLYCLVPVVLWHKVAQRVFVLKELWWYLSDHGYLAKTAVFAGIGLAGLEIIVLSFTYRELLSVGLLAIGLWEFFNAKKGESNRAQVLGWSISMAILAVFPLLPVVGRKPNYNLVYLAGTVAFVLAIYIFSRKEVHIFTSYSHQKSSKLLPIVQICIIPLSVFILRTTHGSIGRDEGLPVLNRLISWLILVVSVTSPMFSSSRMYTRLAHIAVAFIPPYLLLSTAHESLFILVLCSVMLFWLQLESSASRRSRTKPEDMDFSVTFHLGEAQRKLALDDLRCAYYFIFLLVVAFFGTGNIASINSFDPASVLCFLTVFSPFVMGALMLWKVLMPFVLVTCTFNAIHLAVNVPTQSLFLVVMLMSDFMAMNFFFLVRDYGSWLEIGTSISHYVIVMSLIIFLNVLLAISKVFTNVRFGAIYHQSDKQH